MNKDKAVITFPTIIFAQITDSHLFADPNGLHHGHHVLANVKKVLKSIRENTEISYLIFTGDLTQDHTEKSYQHFVDAVHASGLTIPIYYLAGNHDEPALLAKYFSGEPFSTDKIITHDNWQIQLIESKSDTPAGFVQTKTLHTLTQNIDKTKDQCVMMHHHPIDVGYFIDKHGLENKQEFWQTITAFQNIRAIACGHVHGAITLKSSQLTPDEYQPTAKTSKPPTVTLYTCPATSMQFDPSIEGVGALDKGPGYRIFYLQEKGKIQSNVVYL